MSTTAIPSPDGTLDRRTVAKGAVWSVAVITAAAPAPAMAVSNCANTSFSAPPPATSTTQAGRTTTFTVPPGVTTITYTVMGATGGATGSGNQGGPGSVVVGQLQVVPGTALTLVVGAGGINSGSTSGGTNIGGGGYGKGGDSTLPTGLSSAQAYVGSSGGGGSAILVAGVPIVVAGGGGGAGRIGFSPGSTSPNNIVAEQATTPRPHGAPGDTSAADPVWTWNPAEAGFPNIVATTPGGDAGTLAAGGAGGSGPAGSVSAGTRITPSTSSGGAGQGVTAGGAAGGNGTYAGYATWTYPSPLETVLALYGGSGGGGGGYTGGGGGAAIAGTWQPPNVPHPSGVGLGAGGAGGTSYVATTGVVGVTPLPGAAINPGTQVNSASGTRLHGSIVLTYCV